MYYVKRNFNRLPIAEKIARARRIQGKIEKNKKFRDPNPSMQEFGDKINALEQAFAEARDGSKTKKVFMHGIKRELNDMIVTLSSYVQHISRGDEQMIAESGFDVRPGRSPAQDVGAPENLYCKPTNREGETVLHWQGVKNARSYFVQISTDEGVTWTAHETATKRKLLVKNLIGPTKPLFRVTAIGAKGRGGWSNPAPAKILW